MSDANRPGSNDDELPSELRIRARVVTYRR
jgi:hypothetical protein